MAVLASTILACCVCLLPVGPAEAGTPFTDAAELTGGLQQGCVVNNPFCDRSIACTCKANPLIETRYHILIFVS